MAPTSLLVVWSEMGVGKEPEAQTKGKALCYQGKSHCPSRRGTLPTVGPPGVGAAVLVWLGLADPSLFAPAPRLASPKVPDLNPCPERPITAQVCLT